MNNPFITGTFKSSFSTTIIGKIENPVIYLRDINLRGRKILYEAEFFLSEPAFSKDDLYLKDSFIPNVEIFPKSGLEKPLDKAKKLNLYHVRIINPLIIHQQDIEGIRHGVIEGLLYAKISKDEDIQPVISRNEFKTDNQNIEPVVDTQPLVPTPPLTNSGCLTLGLFNRSSLNNSLIEKPGCMPGASLISKRGCLPGGGCLGIFRNGCLSILLLLFLLGLFSKILKSCSDYITKETKSEKIETDNKTTDHFLNDSNYQYENIDTIPYSDQDSTSFINKDSTTNLKDKTIKEIRTISLPNVQFFTNSSVLIPSSKKDLEKLALYLLENQKIKTQIIGHTDNIGEEYKNVVLSQRRADAVKNFLIDSGISSNRIKAIGKGSSEPKAPNDTEEGRLMNRRVEVIFENIKKIED
jgi:outer membrane protein OmpA-like peptidoglycan-associated protein